MSVQGVCRLTRCVLCGGLRLTFLLVFLDILPSFFMPMFLHVCVPLAFLFQTLSLSMFSVSFSLRICLSVHLSDNMSVCPSACLSVRRGVFACLHVCSWLMKGIWTLTWWWCLTLPLWRPWICKATLPVRRRRGGVTFVRKDDTRFCLESIWL